MSKYLNNKFSFLTAQKEIIMENTKNLFEIKTLRQKAAELLKKKPAKSGHRWSESELYDLLEELEIHQNDLEVQQKELLGGKNGAEAEVAKYLELYDFAPCGYFILSEEGIINCLNRYAAQLLALEQSVARGMHLSNWIVSDSKQEFKHFLERIERHKCQQVCTVIFEDQHIGQKYLQLTGTTGTTAGQCLISAVDVSKFKEIEREVKMSEAKYRTLVEQAVDAIVIYSATGDILDAHAGTENFIGYEREELLKMHVYEILTKEEYTAKPIQYEVLQKGVSTVKQRMMRKKDGTYIHTEVRSQQLPDGRFLSLIRDLTESIEAREQIQKEKELSDSIINSLPGIFYLFNKSGKFIRWNKNFEQVMGYNSEEISQMGHNNFYKSEHQMLALKRIENATDTDLQGIELELSTKEHQKIPFYINSRTIDYEAEKCLMGIGIDITRRKQTEAALTASISSLDASLESTADGILIVDKTGKITKWNQKFVKMWQISEDLLFQKDDTIVLRHILSSLADPNQFINKVTFLYAHPEESSYDQIDFLDGRIFERYSQSQKIGNEVVGRVWSFRDITLQKQTEKALRESEAKYRTIFENVQDVFYQVDLAGIILEVSPSCHFFSEFTREEMIGTSVYDYYYEPNDRVIFIKTLQQTGELRDYKLKFKTKSLDIRFASINARLIYNPDGSPSHIDGVIRDITEREKSEQEIAAQNKKLEAQNKELEQFAYITSHDLQEPLRNLISIAGLLKEEFTGKLDQNGDQYLDYIIQSSGRMQELVKALSEYARIGKERVISLVNCNQIVQDALADMSISVKESGASITIENLPQLMGCSTELRQLFQNLIGNALKFRKKEIKPKISISATQQENIWLFEVKDNGIGIHENNKDKIFVIFKRLHNRNDYEGTGIGLSNCKKIVEVHGGNIWVDSNPGEGSTFYFTISNT